jgi:HD-GYP domain-containing protein (c-di-GMP phosphodiesterase class II)
MEFAQLLGSRSFICCPIVCSDKTLGILAVDNVNSKRPLIESDMSLLMGIASSLGISLRNAEHIEANTRQFNSILQVLAASIDARDSLTAGHSEKVTEYCMGICDELEYTGDYREMIRIAALLHDYGKIGVPDDILKKEGALTAEEYEKVKNHADKTREILERIHFEGMYCDIPEIAGAHHEKIDGTGYPHGLKGEEIPEGAQIIAVADYFDAITSKRHYREPMSIDNAFSVLRGHIGEHFRSDFVEALINYYTRTYLSKATSFPYPVRRCANRVPFRADIFFYASGRCIRCETRDISQRGFYIVTSETITLEHPLDLMLSLPEYQVGAIRAKGRIVWVNSPTDPHYLSHPPGFGVELVEFDAGAEEILDSLVRDAFSATRHLEAA